jgi:DNA-binding transcriptional ArsR family regulator
VGQNAYAPALSNMQITSTGGASLGTMQAIAAIEELERTRDVAEAVSYALGHRTRVEMLGILNEGARTPRELARMIHRPLSTVSHHIRELRSAGCIELAATSKVRNTDQNSYRAIKQAEISDEEALALSPDVRQQLAAVILQAVMAEGMSALWEGKFKGDPRKAQLLWRWFHLDSRGQEELREEQLESWDRIREIEARSVGRSGRGKEKTITMIAAILGFERGRPAGTTAPAAFDLTLGKS